MDASCVAIVVTHNRPGMLKEVLESLQKQTLPLSDILVVDNASSPGTREVLNNYPNLRVVRSEINLGGAGGFAKGIETAMDASPDLLWLMDDDAVPEQHAFQKLIEAFDQTPNGIGVLCGAVEEFDALALQHRRTFLAGRLQEKPIQAREYARDHVEIDCASFVGFMIRTSVVRKIGLPESKFFYSYDDTEYSLRIRKAGFSIYLVPASRMQHKRRPGKRLRNGPFGAKHYYHLRNRLPALWESPVLEVDYALMRRFCFIVESEQGKSQGIDRLDAGSI
jgi:rhamnopyranosyl-N-acetylglucosaminyl-diphospho-decaprenol beta-1,3/1,4-galactofuranosyltransferase